MNNTDNDQAVTACEAEPEQKRFGKFDTAEELLRAYNALESEFTKRCQLAGELQARLNALDAQAQRRPPETVENEGARPSPEPTEPTAVAAASAVCAATDTAREAAQYAVPSEILDNPDEYAELLAAIPQVMDACIERYKRRLLGERGGHAASPRGTAVIVPVARPKTLADAKRLAEQML